MNIVSPAADEVSEDNDSDEATDDDEMENYDDFDDIEEDFPLDFDLEAYDED